MEHDFGNLGTVIVQTLKFLLFEQACWHTGSLPINDMIVGDSWHVLESVHHCQQRQTGNLKMRKQNLFVLKSNVHAGIVMALIVSKEAP